MPRQVLVLNSTYEPVNVCSTRRAVVLLLKEKAEVLEAGKGLIRSERATLVAPVVIRLRSYVRLPRADNRRLSRRTILARDGFRCQYCGSTRHLTIDHVVPRSRGGPHTWENVVAACGRCNTAKRDRLLEETGMRLRCRPHAPSHLSWVAVAVSRVPDDWARYLSHAIPA